MRMECRLRTITHSYVFQLLIVHRQGMHRIAPLAQDHCKHQKENIAMLKPQLLCRRH